MQAITRRLRHQSAQPATSISSLKSVYPLSDYCNSIISSSFLGFVRQILAPPFLYIFCKILQIMELIIGDLDLLRSPLPVPATLFVRALVEDLLLGNYYPIFSLHFPSNVDNILSTLFGIM